MGQSRKASGIEVLCNVGSGFLLALCIQLIICHFMDWEAKIHQNITITSIFTVASIIRSYFWRRGFNYLYEKGILK